MILNTASTMTNLSLNSQNRLFSCSRIRLLIAFLVFHLIKISFVIPEDCAIIFNTASLVYKFMKQRNKKITIIAYVAADAPTFFFFNKNVLRNPRIVGKHLPIPNILIFHFFFQYRFFISLFHKFKYRWGSTKYYRTGLRFHETYFYENYLWNPWTWK